MILSPYCCIWYLRLALLEMGQYIMVAFAILWHYIHQSTRGQQQCSQSFLRVTATEGLVDQSNSQDLCS